MLMTDDMFRPVYIKPSSYMVHSIT